VLDAFALSDQGCVRENNEDYYRIEPELGLYAVADGMGGARAGETASRLAVDTVAENVGAAASRDAQVLLAAVESANRRVFEAAESDPNLEGMGTTIVAALETSQGLSIASVGDSRAYLLDDLGFRPVTRDQTWVNEVGRPLGIAEEALRRHPMRHVLTMAIGVAKSLTVNCYAVELGARSLVLLSSDGLHGVVEPGEIEAILRSADGAPLPATCSRLVEAARSAGGPDNITVLLLRR
jgi:PPM family protein phosphatase